MKDGETQSYLCGALVYLTVFLDVARSACLATAVFPTGPAAACS